MASRGRIVPAGAPTTATTNSQLRSTGTTSNDPALRPLPTRPCLDIRIQTPAQVSGVRPLASIRTGVRAYGRVEPLRQPRGHDTGLAGLTFLSVRGVGCVTRPASRGIGGGPCVVGVATTRDGWRRVLVVVRAQEGPTAESVADDSQRLARTVARGSGGARHRRRSCVRIQPRFDRPSPDRIPHAHGVRAAAGGAVAFAVVGATTSWSAAVASRPTSRRPDRGKEISPRPAKPGGAISRCSDSGEVLRRLAQVDHPGHDEARRIERDEADVGAVAVLVRKE
jgi:hypothetical protein